uniref:Palmitoyltransferase n=1 Tax=Sinocyclocheilus anshuiensis TaxID=1608454 RepID=A0A671S999_9TELE
QRLFKTYIVRLFKQCKSLLSLFINLTHPYLRKCQERGDLVQPVVFSSVVLLSVLLYFTVSLMDPGFVLDAAATALNWYFINLNQPMRARHCKTCEHCVRRFDHHCPWIDNCVGERNHKWFLLYLCVQFVAVSWGLQASSGVVFAPTWQQWFSQNRFLLGAFAVTAVFSVVVLLLLCIHLFLASVNSTTWEFMSRQRIVYLKHCDSEENPFDRGVFCNLWHFCCVCGTVAWERIYVRRTNGAK